MIASVAFRNFKALRNAHLSLGLFNLVIGPNGSGKTSLIQALLRLRQLAKLPLQIPVDEADRLAGGPEITFHFSPPHDGLEIVMACVADMQCDLLQVVPLPSGEGGEDWAGLRKQVLRIRSYVLDHRAMEAPAMIKDGAELSLGGGNLAAVLTNRRARHPESHARLVADFVRITPEFSDILLEPTTDGRIALVLKLAGDRERVTADNLSQGSLYLLALLALAHDPDPPAVVCIEEIDRGIHPRLLREVRDSLYRLSYPAACGETRPPVQIIATTHSPYLLDLFRNHPDEVVIAAKEGREATFSRLSDRGDLAEMLEEGTLGDMWFSGVLGGVPSVE